MSPRYLLDSTAISEPLRPDPSARFLKTLRARWQEVAIASLNWDEVVFGALRLPKGRKREMVETWLMTVIGAQVPILPFDKAAADWHASERARLASRGRTPPFVDGLIAAVAAVHDLTIVTDNGRDFRHFSGIRIETWKS